MQLMLLGRGNINKRLAIITSCLIDKVGHHTELLGIQTTGNMKAK